MRKLRGDVVSMRGISKQIFVVESFKHLPSLRIQKKEKKLGQYVNIFVCDLMQGIGSIAVNEGISYGIYILSGSSNVLVFEWCCEGSYASRRGAQSSRMQLSIVALFFYINQVYRTT